MPLFPGTFFFHQLSIIVHIHTVEPLLTLWKKKTYGLWAMRGAGDFWCKSDFWFPKKLPMGYNIYYAYGLTEVWVMTLMSSSSTTKYLPQTDMIRALSGCDQNFRKRCTYIHIVQRFMISKCTFQSICCYRKLHFRPAFLAAVRARVICFFHPKHWLQAVGKKSYYQNTRP